jgi:hypothetical protein
VTATQLRKALPGCTGEKTEKIRNLVEQGIIVEEINGNKKIYKRISEER